MSREDLEVMREFVERFLGGDLAGTLALIHPEAVVNEGAGLPWGGDHVGRCGFQSLVAALLGTFDLKIDSYDLLDAGDTVVARMPATFTHRTTGRCLPMPIVELYQLRDGLIWRIDVFYKDTKAIADAVAEAHPA